MKKFLSLFLILVLLLTLAVPSFAAASDITLAYILESEGSSDITVKKGDVITVTYYIANRNLSQDAETSTTQNQILYDHNFFELVSGSLKLNEETADAFMTSTPIDSDAAQSHYIFVNSLQALTVYAGEKWEVMTFQLKVIASSGSSTVKNTSLMATANGSALFAALSQDLNVTISGTGKIPVTGITLDRAEATLAEAKTTQLTATVLPSNATNSKVTWSSDNTNVATVSNTGLVTAVAEGTANITAQTEDGAKTVSCRITVQKDAIPVTGVSLNAATATLTEGETMTLTATVEPSDATNPNVLWTTDNASVATVDAAGKVTAVAKGTATITATTEDEGKTAACTVTVEAKDGMVTVRQANHGTIELQTEDAQQGDEVRFTVTPDKDYEISTISVTDADGTTLAVKALGNDTYSFTLPEKAVTITASFQSNGTLTNPFVDVSSKKYYYDAVLWAVDNGITGGKDTTHFGPDDYTTRAQMVTFLWRAAGCPQPKTATNPFTDVRSSAYYYKAVLWAVENGITKGNSATTFNPNGYVTRGQTAAFLYRYEGSPAVTASNAFTDVTAGSYYYDAVLWAAKNGITTGLTATTFVPGNYCTRAQIVTFLYRDLA